MDIQKEREAFEEWFDNVYDVNNNSSLHAQEFAWIVWQAAKAEAVPEGFIVLAIDDMERICRCLDDHAVYITYKASDALESIQKAMTEAQEPK